MERPFEQWIRGRTANSGVCRGQEGNVRVMPLEYMRKTAKTNKRDQGRLSLVSKRQWLGVELHRDKAACPAKLYPRVVE